MAIKLGNNNISTLKLGSQQVDKIYLGSTELWANYTLYSITPTLTNVTADANNPTSIGTGETKTLIYYADGTSYNLPTDVSISGATKVSWTVIDVYNISATATNATINGSASYSGTIEAGGTLTLTLGADGTSYKLPTSISVSGATGTFTRTSDTSGALVISNPTGDVSFSVVGEPATQPMPVKGQIINLNLDGTVRQYRVLKVNGTQAEVVAMFEANTSIAFNANASCFLTGTKINLADGTTKNIEDITYDDELLVWNFDEGKLDSAKPCWLTVAGLMNNHYYQLTFSDGTILKTTGVNSNHRVYNVTQQKFVGVDKTLVGDAIYSLNGIVTVTDKQYIEEEVEYYNIITSQQFDCFAEGILTSDRYGNMYNIDSDMKWIKDGREIRPYSDYEAVGISEYWYNHLRLGEQNETLEKTVDYINKCESQMRPLNEEE